MSGIRASRNWNARRDGLPAVDWMRSADTRIAELERETRRLQRKLTQAETIIGIQKKVATQLGIPLQSVDDDEHD